MAAPGKKIGRPSKYRKEFDEQATKYCILGATNQQLADFFEVSITAIEKWMREKPSFMRAIKKGREEADANVGKSLYQRACGYSHPEDKIHVTKDGDVITIPTTKHYPPDATSCIFWLKNRRPDQWREKKEVTIELGDEIQKRLTQARERVIDGELIDSSD